MVPSILIVTKDIECFSNMRSSRQFGKVALVNVHLVGERSHLSIDGIGVSEIESMLRLVLQGVNLRPP
jgi:hypothetical protein